MSHYHRTVKRDIKILLLFDQGELAPKEIAVKLHLTSTDLVYDAIKRRKKEKKFYAEQLSQTYPNSPMDSKT